LSWRRRGHVRADARYARSASTGRQVRSDLTDGSFAAGTGCGSREKNNNKI